jgi:hypothetical protein
MKRVWPILNPALVIVAVWSGYASLAPEALRGTNPDGMFGLPPWS